MMNPGVEISDESNIEITIPGDEIPISDIYWCALWGDWSEMKPIVTNDPDSVLIALTKTGDTALHVAAGAGNTNFVKELTEVMKTEYQVIPNSEGMLAVHLAALSGHHRIVKHFCSQQHLLDNMAYKDIETFHLAN